MLQFYFLSVLFNLIVGLILVNSRSTNEEKALAIADDASAAENNEQSVEVEEPKVAKKTSKLNKIGQEIRNTSLFESKTFRLVMGILAILTGILKFISVIKTDVPVVGDLLPAIAGLAGGFCLVLDYYLKSATIDVNLPAALKNVFVKNSNVIGFLSIVVAVLHFVFPTVLFL